MTKEELKNKCTERAKIFQQAMESCKSSNPMDCIEWFADRILELEQEKQGLKVYCDDYVKTILSLRENVADLEKENARLTTNEKTLLAERKIIVKENAELKEELKDANEKVVHLACNQNEDLKYKLTKAKKLLAKWVELYKPKLEGFPKPPIQVDTEQFLSEVEK